MVAAFMQKSALIALMKEHRFSDESDLSEVDRLAEKYPWCAAFQVLRAVGAKQYDKLDAREHINRAAVYIGDRSKLYTYTAGPFAAIAHPSPEPELTPQAEQNPAASASPSFPAAPAEKNSASAASEDPDPLEVQILSAAAARWGEMAAEEVSADGPLPGEKSRPDAAEETDGAEDDIAAYGAFAKWLRDLDGEDGREKPERKSNLPADDMLEKFIAQSPQITQSKASFFSPSRMGKMSLVEDETFVTETLAKVYERQQDYKKAARAYARLGLKYPEKSTYFDTLQKQAEAKIK